MIVIIILILIYIIILLVHHMLNKQAKCFLKLSKYYTDSFMNCEITLEEYETKRKELRESISPLLKMYMKKEDIIIE